MKLLRALFLFVCAIGLVAMSGYILPGTALALPAGMAGVACVALALV